MTGPAFDYGAPGYQGRLADNTATIAEALHPAGYRTLMAGKWHLGDGPGLLPPDRGFDRYLGIVGGATDYFQPKLVSGREPIETPPDCYTTDVFTDAALGFVAEARRDRSPYFLYLAYNAPHWPLHARPEDIEKYLGRYDGGWDKLRLERHERQRALGIVDPKWPLSPRDPQVPAWDSLSAAQRKKMSRKMGVYAAMVDRMDQNIGRLLADLQAAGELDNTLVLFLSDNGACAEIGAMGFDYQPKYPTPPARTVLEIGTPHSNSSYGRSWANAGNTPFRMFKHWVHEGGISSPLLAHWPARLGSRQISEVGHVMDLMPTLLDAAGASALTERKGLPLPPLEGRSLLPAMTGAVGPERIIGWEHEGNRAWRRGDLKLVSSFPDGGRWELFDLAADRTEMIDLAAKSPEKVSELTKEYEAWAARVGVVPWKKSNAYLPWIKEAFKPGGD
jgi:arylsulfatase